MPKVSYTADARAKLEETMNRTMKATKPHIDTVMASPVGPYISEAGKEAYGFLQRHSNTLRMVGYGAAGAAGTYALLTSLPGIRFFTNTGCEVTTDEENNQLTQCSNMLYHTVNSAVGAAWAFSKNTALALSAYEAGIKLYGEAYKIGFKYALDHGWVDAPKLPQPLATKQVDSASAVDAVTTDESEIAASVHAPENTNNAEAEQASSMKVGN